MRATVGILFLSLASVLNSFAYDILDDMDPKIKPCDDFYNFACGNFIKKTILKKNDLFVDKTSLLNEKVQQQLKTLIEEPIQSNEPAFSKYTKNYYKACMDTTSIEKIGLQLILQDLRALGGWSTLGKNSSKNKSLDWINTIYTLKKLGYSTDLLFSIDAFSEIDTPSSQLLLDTPSFGIDPQYLMKGFSEKMVDAYYNYMVDMTAILGANIVTAEKEIKESVDFEIKLAKISMEHLNSANNNSPYKPMTLKEISRKYPSIPWTEYFKTILTPFTKIDDSEVIMVNNSPFFKNLENLLKETSANTLANYLLGRAVHEAAQYSTEKLRTRRLQFLSVFNNEAEMPPRWKECLNPGLDTSLSALYVRKYVSPESKKSAVVLVTSIKNQFTKILKKTDWMDEKTRKSALDKINAMIEFIGYSDEFLNDNKMNDVYKDVSVPSLNFLRTSLVLSRFSTVLSLKHLKEPLTKSFWPFFTVTSSANLRYSVNINSLIMAAPMIQDTFHDKDMLPYMCLAAIGPFIAREITRSFDEQGSQFDKNGVGREWWQPETKKKYAEKTKCIVQQYTNYKLNGEETKNENLLDNEAVKAAYLAYQDWAKQPGSKTSSSVGNYTSAQKFWIISAQSLCTKYTEAGLQGTIPQSPAEFRVRGAFSNRPEFAKDFYCPVGSNMNPAKKCPVW